MKKPPIAAIAAMGGNFLSELLFSGYADRKIHFGARFCGRRVFTLQKKADDQRDHRARNAEQTGQKPRPPHDRDLYAGDQIQ